MEECSIDFRTFLICFFLILLTGCDGPAEQAGENLDKQVTAPRNEVADLKRQIEYYKQTIKQTREELAASKEQLRLAEKELEMTKLSRQEILQEMERVQEKAQTEASPLEQQKLTDKTGTLTENKMAVRELLTPLESMSLVDHSEKQVDQQENNNKPSILRLLKIGALCSNAQPDDGGGYTGDPTEVALLEAAAEHGVQWRKLAEELEEVEEIPFDSEKMMMATFHQAKNGEGDGSPYYVAVKGAPDQVLQACDHILTGNGFTTLSNERHREWTGRVDDLAAKGLRLLAFADKEVADVTEKAYEKLRFVGLAAMEDPPRSDVREAIEQCQEAGIRVVMVTGDRAGTGSVIGEKVGLNIDGKAFHGQDLGDPEEFSAKERKRIQGASVFARVTPEQKFHLVKLYQDSGQIIAMTGDGVNDAPALKQADIGVAMGQRGMDAAKQVADMVLRDDNFATIVAAV